MTVPADPTPESFAAAWTARTDAFTAAVDRVEDWQAATPCEGWSALDVLDHVMQTQTQFVERHGREIPVFRSEAGDPREQWVQHAAAMKGLAQDEDFMAQAMDTPFGQSSVGDALMAFYGLDLLVHRWDLAVSQGVHDGPGELTQDELDVIETSMDSWGDQARGPETFADPVPVLADAPRQARVLAATGRDAARW